MSGYLMATNPDTHKHLDEIVAQMTDLFGISRAEAVARVNAQWRDLDLSDAHDMILHEVPYFWALFIYYGGDVPDWRENADRSSWKVKDPPPPDSGCWTVPG